MRRIGEDDEDDSPSVASDHSSFGYLSHDEYDDLFGEEEQALTIDLERRRVHSDPDLGEAERAERLAALEAELPPQVRDARAQARAPMRLHQQTEAMREAGASDAEVFAAMATNPRLIQRPIGLSGGKAALGRPIENLLKIR